MPTLAQPCLVLVYVPVGDQDGSVAPAVVRTPDDQQPLSLSSVEEAWVLCAICTILNFHLSVNASLWSNPEKEGGLGGSVQVWPRNGTQSILGRSLAQKDGELAIRDAA